MRRLVSVVSLALLLIACGGAASTPTAAPTATADIRPTQTRAAELAQLATLSVPPATSAATATPLPPTVTPTSAATATATRPPATNTPPRPTATATSGKVELVTANVSSARDSIGSLYFIGEVVNSGATDAANIQSAISLLNDAGQVAASGQATTISVAVLPAGQKTVWEALIQNAPDQWKEERIQLQSSPVTASTRSLFASGLAAEGVTVNPPATQFASPTVVGQVRNGGDAVAKFVLVTVGGYDASGKLVLVEIGTTQLQEIAPGATAPFSASLLGVKEAPTAVEVYVRGTR